MSQKLPDGNRESASPRPASRRGGKSVNCLLIVIAATALVCGLGIIAGRPLLEDVLPRSPTPTLAPVIHQVSMADLQNVAKLVSTEYYLVDEVQYTQIPDNVAQYLGFRREFLALLYGTVAAGFDLTDWPLEDNLWQDGSQVMLKLPPPQVLYVDVDFERSHIVDTGGWCPVGCPEPVTDYMEKALPEAEGNLKGQAIEYGLLEQTARSGRDYFSHFLRSQGLTEVRVVVDGYIYE